MIHVESSITLVHVAASAQSQSNQWYTPLLSGGFALGGVLIAQGIVLYIARRNDRRRSEPELLKHCADFSAACGRIKRELALKAPEDRDLSCIAQLESSYDALIIIGTPEIENAAERFIGALPVVFHIEQTGSQERQNGYRSELFLAHRLFIDAVRAHFGRPEKIYMATPMIKVPETRSKPRPMQNKQSTTRERREPKKTKPTASS